MQLAAGTSSKYVNLRTIFERAGGTNDERFPSYIHQYLSVLERGEWLIINKCTIRHLADDRWSATVNSYSRTYRETRRYDTMNEIYRVIVEGRHIETPGRSGGRNG